MTANERRELLKDILCQRRKETVVNLANELDVSTKTIRRDIEVLSCMFPIETVPGRHGGVRVLSWFYPSRSKLCFEQLQLLRKVANTLTGDELVIMNSIIDQFAP